MADDPCLGVSMLDLKCAGSVVDLTVGMFELDCLLLNRTLSHLRIPAKNSNQAYFLQSASQQGRIFSGSVRGRFHL